MKLSPKDTLTPEEIQRGLRAVIQDGVASQAMATLTGGVLLVAFALKLGASNSLIGVLAAIPPLCQLLQLPAIYLVEAVRNRRLICVTASAVSRAFLALMALLPFIPGIDRVALLLFSFLGNAAFAAISAAAWSSWMRDLIPQNLLGSFFSRRMALATGVSIPLGILAGIFADHGPDLFPPGGLPAYMILFALGFLVGMAGVYFISTIPEPRMPPAGRPESLRLLSAPLKDLNFGNLLFFSVPWSFAVNLVTPFLTVYMLQRLDLRIYFVVSMGILSQIVQMGFFGVWGRLADRFSNKSVLLVSGPLFVWTFLIWTFTTMPHRYFLTIPFVVTIHVLTGISTAGINLALGNIGLKLAPQDRATAYLSLLNLGNSLAAGLGPMLGGQLADFFVKRELSLVLHYAGPHGEITLPTFSLESWDFLFIIAFFLGLYSLHRLTFVREVGEEKEKTVLLQFLMEVRRPLRTLSTVGGLIQSFFLPPPRSAAVLRRKGS